MTHAERKRLWQQHIEDWQASTPVKTVSVTICLNPLRYRGSPQTKIITDRPTEVLS